MQCVVAVPLQEVTKTCGWQQMEKSLPKGEDAQVPALCAAPSLLWFGAT